MADENKVNDLVNGKVEIAPGIVVDDRLRLGGVLYLERTFGKPLTEIFESLTGDNPSFTDMSRLLQALYLQANKDSLESQAEEKLAALELNQVAEAFGKLRFLEFAPKNAEPPATPASPS